MTTRGLVVRGEQRGDVTDHVDADDRKKDDHVRLRHVGGFLAKVFKLPATSDRDGMELLNTKPSNLIIRSLASFFVKC